MAKFRSDFVTNSSSSSFICDFCQEEFTGWDVSPSDVEHHYCENYHAICDENFLEGFNEHLESDEYDYEIPENLCPCCQFEVLATSDLNKYLKKISDVTEEEVFAIIKSANKRRRKLYPEEYNTYVLVKLEKTEEDIRLEMKEKFENYEAFRNFVLDRK